MTFILTRIQVGDYDTWKALFDQDVPGTRRDATQHRVFRNTDDPNEVFIEIDFDRSTPPAQHGSGSVASGVLDQFDDRTGPNVVDEIAETVAHPGG